MRIPSKEIPQADSLDIVQHSIKAIAHGAQTDNDIAIKFNYDARQGRYYRLATELLGFTMRISGNISQLTPLGQEWINASDDQRMELLAKSILGCKIIQ